MMPRLIGARLKALREKRKLSQDDLARLLGFKDRQLGILVLMVDAQTAFRMQPAGCLNWTRF